MYGMSLNDRCKVYDTLRKGALNVTRSEWISLGKMFHRAFMETRDIRAKQARDTALQNARTID